jgi:renalase
VEPPVLVIGAGLAGLAAARTLQEAGRRAVVLDKGRGPGGRLATRRMGRAVLDHGAQFFTVRSDELAAQVADWTERGLVAPWCHGFDDDPDGHPRYVATGGMNSLAKDLARGLDVRTGLQADAVIPVADGFAVSFAGGQAPPEEGGACIATPPVPQTLDLLAAGGVGLASATADALRALRYHPVLALLVRLDRDPGLPAPGGIQQPDHPVYTFIADNRAKGISPEPAVTFHTAHALAADRWHRPDAEVRDELLEQARPWLGGAQPLEVQLKRWRYAGPVEPWPERCLTVVDSPAPLVLAGDAFGGPRFEGAYCSGLAAAGAVLAAS